MSSNDLNLQMDYFKNRIKQQLSTIKQDIGELRYKLYCAMVDECTDYDELRDMAELELQIEMAEYIRDIKRRLEENNISIESIKSGAYEKVSTAAKEEEKPFDIVEELEDEESAEIMALILSHRLKNEPLEELYRNELEDSIDIENSISYIESIDMEELESGEDDSGDLSEYEDADDKDSEYADSAFDIEELDFEDDNGEEGEEVDTDEDGDDGLDIDISELFDETDEDTEDEENDGDFDIDMSEIFDETDEDDEDGAEEDDDNNNYDLDSELEDYFCEEEDFEDSDNEGEDIEEGFDVDESELLGDLFDESEDEDGDEEDPFDNIDESELIGSTFEEDDEEEEADIFSGISDEDLLGFDYEVEETKPPKAKIIDDTHKVKEIASGNKPKNAGAVNSTIFLNGTKQGEKTQQVYNIINTIFSGTGKAAKKVAEKAVEKATEKKAKAKRDFIIDDDDTIDF